MTNPTSAVNPSDESRSLREAVSEIARGRGLDHRHPAIPLYQPNPPFPDGPSSERRSPSQRLLPPCRATLSSRRAALLRPT